MTTFSSSSSSSSSFLLFELLMLDSLACEWNAMCVSNEMHFDIQNTLLRQNVFFVVYIERIMSDGVVIHYEICIPIKSYKNVLRSILKIFI